MAQDEIQGPPSVFDYADFRTFLTQWFESKKRANHHFSHRVFARRIGTADPSVLTHVMSGRRPLSRARLGDFCRAMELDEREATYFGLLVRLAQASDAEERRRAWAEMAAIRAEAAGPTLEGNDVTLRSSTLIAILTLAECPGFRSDPAWVADALEPPITQEVAAEALEALERAGMLVASPLGLRPSHATRQTEAEAPVRIDQRYHLDNHKLGGQVLETMFSEDVSVWEQSAFLGFSVAIPASRMREFRGILWDLQLKAMHEAESLGARVTADGRTQSPGATEPDADRVYHVNVQAFPVTRQVS